MEINDFSALIQLAATVSIAFVAVEYVNSYTSLLCKKIFQFENFIKEKYDDCRKALPDDVTLANMQPVVIDGISTNSAIEEVKRKKESLSKQINEDENKKKQDVILACQASSMSSICLYIFLVSTLFLFCAGTEKIYPYETQCFVMIFGLCTIVYLILAWIFGEKKKSWSFLNFASLKHAVISFCIILFLTIVITISIRYFTSAENNFISKGWKIVFIMIVIFSYFNYIIFIAKIWRKANDFKIELEKDKNTLEEKCANTFNEAKELIVANKVGSRLQLATK